MLGIWGATRALAHLLAPPRRLLQPLAVAALDLLESYRQLSLRAMRYAARLLRSHCGLWRKGGAAILVVRKHYRPSN